MPRFTVFTPTFNRAHTLHRVWDSLQAQTSRDFEWLVVDDGSTDETASLVEAWAAEADIPVRYLQQTRAGKHGAINLGVREAAGSLFLMLDSDDGCVPEALERFAAHWESFSDDARDRFVGVTGLCVDQCGSPVGSRFPRDPLDSTPLETTYRFRVRGEKWGFQRVDVLRRHPFPELEGYTGYVPESIVWNEIAKRYLTRYVNEELRIYWRSETPESDQITRGRPGKNAVGQLLYHERLLNDHLRWARYAPLEFARRFVQFNRYAFLAEHPPSWQLRAVRSLPARLAVAATLPLGAWLARRDVASASSPRPDQLDDSEAERGSRSDDRQRDKP